MFCHYRQKLYCIQKYPNATVNCSKAIIFKGSFLHKYKGHFQAKAFKIKQLHCPWWLGPAAANGDTKNNDLTAFPKL